MADKQLGILITKNADLDHIAGVVKAAIQAGHPVRIFVTDEGVQFTRDPKFLELLDLDGVEVAVCDHMCDVLGVKEKAADIIYGSQYDNAGMLHDSERVLVF
jgi:hypothetical protein